MPTPMAVPRSTELLRYGGMTAIVFASGVAITYLVLPPAPEGPRPAPSLRVAGMVVPSAGDLIANTLDRVRRYAAGEFTLRLPNGTSRKIRRSALGAEIDRVRLADFVREAQRPTSAVRRAHDDRNKGADPIDVPLPLTLDASEALARLLDIKAELDAPPRSAFIDLEKHELRKEQVGLELDVYGTLARIDAAFRKGEDSVDAIVETIAPKLTAAELGNVKFDHVLGYFETRYTKGGKTKERTYNLRLAASKLDGSVVLPGQTFDFNGTVGPRDEAHGYRVAPVIAEGEVVDGLGGGTCQISGTLHGAAFFAGLHIVERYPHSRPSYYIKLGLDATVVYPTINFRFQNPFDFPIVLHETVFETKDTGIVRAEILGPARKLTVSFFRRIDEVIPFEEVERPSPKLPEGARALAQRGIPGFRTLSVRVVRDGAYATREKWSDKYPPTTQIIHVGTGPKEDDPKVIDDSHPEYVVDEYLVVTQGPDIHSSGVSSDEPGGGTTEAREPGKTGMSGWTEKSGLTRFHSKDRPEDEPQAEGAVKAASVRADKDGKTADEGADKPKKKRKKKKRAD